MNHEFELTFKLPATTEDVDTLVERLYEAGCDDALVGTGLPGCIALKFNREGDSAQHAMVSAIQDVKKAIRGAVLIEVSPDFVGLSDIADTRSPPHSVRRQNPSGLDDAIKKAAINQVL